jgi:hypothetical protein
LFNRQGELNTLIENLVAGGFLMWSTESNNERETLFRQDWEVDEFSRRRGQLGTSRSRYARRKRKINAATAARRES